MMSEVMLFRLAISLAAARLFTVKIPRVFIVRGRKTTPKIGISSILPPYAQCECPPRGHRQQNDRMHLQTGHFD